LDVVRHYVHLSQRNFGVDTGFYPLGSCTMKYNPKVNEASARLEGFAATHPLQDEHTVQGNLELMFRLQEWLEEIGGFASISLQPTAGAQGEFAGVAMIRAYHVARGEEHRDEIIVPDAAHGTNPATATMCGCTVKELATRADGDLDLDELRAACGPKTAGIMLTNPSTLGVFERQIRSISEIVHTAGGLLYYDGANLNAILGKALPADMGFDVMHINLHKTFATPHGGGGPGSGVVGVNEKLEPFLPVPYVVADGGRFRWAGPQDCPKTIGRLSAFMGNAGVLLRAYVYMRLLGRQGTPRVADYAVLNANYLLARLRQIGFDLAYPQRRASHEFVVTLRTVAKRTGVTAMDFAKALLDKGFHAPTTYFPLLVPECLLIEPTETESKQTLDSFVAAMAEILQQAATNPAQVKQAPLRMPVRRLDDVRAARQLDVRFRPAAAAQDGDKTAAGGA
ncbi:MAG TPA: aminomethyl-transferring glycine dehydrogenase subunit GcvPB, partial [Gammaproteobacteria bacterium]|nr:aminomethyl-transferring glycine dehydrogenase subunit GcvPB [Gammaproteobacteria bacterium]